MHCMHPDKRANYVMSWLCNQPPNQHPLGQEQTLPDADYASSFGVAIARSRSKNQQIYTGKHVIGNL